MPSSSASPSEGVKVICRIRPCRGGTPIAKVNPDGTSLRLTSPNKGADMQANLFAFDTVLGSTSSNGDVHDALQGVVPSVMAGINSAVLAYGQTGSGKTHTIHGVPSHNILGAASLLLRELFEHVYNAPEGIRYDVECEYFQVYKEKVLDLISPSNKVFVKANGEIVGSLKVRCDKGTWFVEGVTKVHVYSVGEVISLLSNGEKNRRVASTNQNEFSSRSHSILVLRVQRTELVADEEVTSTLSIVDLAGSENADRAATQGLALEEGRQINRSLLALRGVITALADKQAHVPYRDSVLTCLLQNSFGGNSKTVMICCISADVDDFRDSLNTCLFGQTSKTVTNRVEVNVKKSIPLLRRILAQTNDQLTQLLDEVRRMEKKLMSASAAKGLSVSLPSVVFAEMPKQPPPVLCCKLSRAIFVNPVIAPDGRTYEERHLCQFVAAMGRLPSDPSMGGRKSSTPPPRRPTIVTRADNEMERRVSKYLLGCVSNNSLVSYMRRRGTFIGLPFDCQLAVLEYVYPSDVMSLHRSNRELRSITSCDDVWENIVLRELGRDSLHKFSLSRHQTYYKFYWMLRREKREGVVMDVTARGRTPLYLPSSS